MYRHVRSRLQARARLESAVTTLYVSARRRSPFSSRLGGVLGSARRSFVRGTRVGCSQQSFHFSAFSHALN